jgi:hemolysin activation/secretion protein
MLSHDADDERYIAVSESVPVSSDGMLLRLDAYHFGADTPISVGSNPIGADRQADSRVSVSLSQPLVLEIDRQLSVTGGFDVAHNTDRYSGAALEALDDQVENLRIVHVGVSAAVVLAPQQISASADVYRGLDGLGASASNPMINPGFTRLVLALSDKISWSSTLSSNLALRGQYSHDKLPSSEQIAFGGGQFALAYPISDEVGDRGYGVSADLGRSFALDMGYLKSVEPYIALDTARAYSNLLGAVPPRMASLAFGARVSDGHYYNFDLSIARPIGAIPIDGDRRALRVNLTYSYRSD